MLIIKCLVVIPLIFITRAIFSSLRFHYFDLNINTNFNRTKDQIKETKQQSLV